MDHGAFPLWVIHMQFHLYDNLFIVALSSLSWSFQLITHSDLGLQGTRIFQLHIGLLSNLQLNHSLILLQVQYLHMV